MRDPSIKRTIVPKKETRWFLIGSVWNRLDYKHCTIDNMMDNITLPEQDWVPYTVTTEELCSANKLHGVKLTLTENQDKQKRIMKTSWSCLFPKFSPRSVTRLLL